MLIITKLYVTFHLEVTSKIVNYYSQKEVWDEKSKIIFFIGIYFSVCRMSLFKWNKRERGSSKRNPRYI